MTTLLSNERIDLSKSYVFKHGRLLERQLFNHFFGNGAREACLKALFAYQNSDGGFGNALEPDLSCPESSAIGAETAMFVMGLVDHHETASIRDLVTWIKSNLNQDGYISHPPRGLPEYPHQRWWETADKERILSLAGILKHWGYDDDEFYAKVRSFFSQVALPEGDMFYSYPILVYLK